MTDQAAWFARFAALVVTLVAGVTLFAAMPEREDMMSAAAAERSRCAADALVRFSQALDVNPEAAMRRRAEFDAHCPAPLRTTWEPAGLQRGLILGGVALALLLTSVVLGSMAKREALAEEALREMKRRRHD
jgi:hypothetical protein